MNSSGNAFECMHINFDQAHYFYFNGKGATSIMCDLNNPTNGKLSINRDEFIIASSKGIRYLAEPFRSLLIFSRHLRQAIDDDLIGKKSNGNT